MDKTVSTYASLKEMKADEYRYWQSRPAYERMSAVSELTIAAYAMKVPAPNIRLLLENIASLQRLQH
jgi:hypothetical protein